jgi:hypothetical protein
VGVDLSHAKPQKLTDELAQQAQLLVTMVCGDKFLMFLVCVEMTGRYKTRRDFPSKGFGEYETKYTRKSASFWDARVSNKALHL